MTTLIDNTKPESNFTTSVPTLQWAWDSVSLGLLKECARKYQYQMILGYQPKGTSIHLSFGIAYHKAQEVYNHYRAEGVDHEDAIKAMASYCLQFQDPKGEVDPNKNRITLLRSAVWHAEHYKHDPLQTYILSDGKPACELSFRMEMDLETPDGKPFMLCGHLDRVAVMDNSFYILDYKTSKTTLSDYYFKQYSPNNQMTLYFAAAQVVLKSPARGLYIDAAQVLVSGTRFARRAIHRSQGQLAEWHNEIHWWMQQAWRYAEANYWPMNDKACSNYGGCAFQPVCSVDPSLRDRVLKQDYEKFNWNPLEVRGDL